MLHAPVFNNSPGGGLVVGEIEQRRQRVVGNGFILVRCQAQELLGRRLREGLLQISLHREEVEHLDGVRLLLVGAVAREGDDGLDVVGGLCGGQRGARRLERRHHRTVDGSQRRFNF